MNLIDIVLLNKTYATILIDAVGSKIMILYRMDFQFHLSVLEFGFCLQLYQCYYNIINALLLSRCQDKR